MDYIWNMIPIWLVFIYIYALFLLVLVCFCCDVALYGLSKAVWTAYLSHGGDKCIHEAGIYTRPTEPVC